MSSKHQKCRNRLTCLPSAICQLPLEILLLSNNKLKQLPTEIGFCKTLIELDVSCNVLINLPPQLGQLSSLKCLNAQNNLLIELPLVTLKSQTSMVFLRPKLVDFKTKWEELEQTLHAILRLDKVPREEWYARFNDIYAMCGSVPQCHETRLFESTQSLLEEHVTKILSIIQTGDTANLLKDYFTQWEKYRVGAEHVNSLYQYFNMENNSKRNMLEITHSDPCPNDPIYILIGELAFNIWKRIIIQPLKHNISKLLLVEIHKLRYDTMPIDMHMVGCVLHSFIAVYKPVKNPLKFYQIYFETPFLEKTSEYFKLEASRLIKKCTVSQYMVEVLQIMEEEELRFKTYLHASTYKKLQLSFCQHMVLDNLCFLKEESESIIKEERMEDMHNIYLLFRDVKDELILLANIFKKHVLERGFEVMKSLKKNQIHVHFVEEVLAIHKVYETIVINNFKNDFLFSEALDRALSKIINCELVENQQSKASEYLSEYCDKLLKKSCKGLSEAEIDRKLSQSIKIFNYIDDKDIFHEIYQRKLAKRLIFRLTQSTDGEEGMINKLKQASGFSYTNKLHQMFTDIRVSEGLNLQFQNEFLKESKLKKLNFSFSAYVLQNGAWPLTLTTVSSIVIPKQLTSYLQNFELFYNEKFNGRKLTWLHQHSQVELKLNYLEKMHIVTMQMFQVSIMLLFEDCNTLKYSEINDILKLNDDQFKKHINSLIECKLLLLDGENVTLNMAFTDKRTKLRITLVVQKDQPEDIQHSINSVKDDRKVYLQANIIRIMKMRKTLKYNQLVTEIFSQSNAFSPSTVLIKRTIEILIDKGYLSRTPNVSDEYNYVA